VGTLNTKSTPVIAFGFLASLILILCSSTVLAQPIESVKTTGSKMLLSFGSIDQPTLFTQFESVYAFWNKDTEEDTFAFLKRSIDGGSSFGKSTSLIASFDLPGISTSDNNVYVTWEDENFSQNHSVIAYERSTDRGSTFENSVIVSEKDVHSVNPKIVTYGNYVYLAWQSKPYDNFDIYFRSSNDSGVTFGNITNLSNNAGYSNFESSDEDSVHLAADGANIYVIWKDNTNNVLSTPYSPGDLYISYSNDKGMTFQEPKILMHGVEYTNIFVKAFENNVYVLADETGTNKDVLLLTSRDNGKTFSEPLNLSNNNQYEPTTGTQVILDKNNLYLLWTKEKDVGQDILLTSSHDKGVTFDEPVDVSTGIYANYRNVDYWDNDSPRMALSGPYLFVIWDNVINTLDFDEIHNLLIRGSANDGKTFEPPKVISKDIGDSSFYDIKANNEIAYILFMDSPIKYTSESDEDNYELYFQKTSISGSELENAKQFVGGGPKEITVSVNVENDPLILGRKQIINVAASDAFSDESLKAADVDVTVENELEIKKHFSGKTDEFGKVSFSWTIGKFNIPGTYSVEAQVSAEGYGSASDDTEFEVEIESDDQ
jgi:hypothetical protein